MNADRLKSYIKYRGASLAGIADLAPFKEEGFAYEPTRLDPYIRAVSLAVALDYGIINEIDDRPTPRYARHYRDINLWLDELASNAAEWITREGYQAERIPASLILSEERLMGHISHKAVARMAGLGWQGKSLLIITPEFGPRVRLVTVLTDMPLEPDGPVENRCGNCSECVEACPVGAIRNVPAHGRYATREDAIDLALCNDRSHESFATPGIGARICGVCIRACPVGKKRIAVP